MAPLRFLQQGMGQGVAAGVFHAGRQLQSACRVSAGHHLGDQGPPQGEGAGFVEHHPVQRSGQFDHIAPTKQPSLPGCQSRRHRDHRGGRQAESTGTSDHQHRNRQLQGEPQRGFSTSPQGGVQAMAMGGVLVGRVHRRRQHLGPEPWPHLPPEQKREGGEADHAVAEHPGHPIGEALNRSLASLGLLHQSNDPRQGRLGANPLHLQFKGGFKVEAARRQLRAGGCFQRQWLTGEARHINGRAAFSHHPIHRDAIASQQLQPFPWAHGRHGHFAHAAIGHHQTGLVRLQCRQLLQRPTGAQPCALLEETTQQHEAEQHHWLVEETGPAHLGPDQGHDAGEISAAYPQSHQGVHARGPSPHRLPAPHQDGATGTDQRHGGQGGVEGEIPQHRNAEVTALRQVTHHGEHQQHQRHHQLAPLAPPAPAAGRILACACQS